MADIIANISLFRRNHTEHTVTGIRKMHVSVIELGLRLCQPKQHCADCTANGVWWMGLDVRYIYCSNFFSLDSFADF
jgi:hypothetical protein